MLSYRASYKLSNDGIHVEVLDFPGVITCAEDSNQARELLADAPGEMAETIILLGENLPVPD